ncbi:hypothetical protein RUM43_000964 [Polyplax serrata]|uniref:Uncharacterized protein n=1 Tax=Polyplax serrata TaxID=468196 RepID=A0AAN8XRA4_POLSC
MVELGLFYGGVPTTDQQYHGTHTKIDAAFSLRKRTSQEEQKRIYGIPEIMRRRRLPGNPKTYTCFFVWDLSNVLEEEEDEEAGDFMVNMESFLRALTFELFLFISCHREQKDPLYHPNKK